MADPSAAASRQPPARALPLAELLRLTAAALQAVEGGRSLDAVLADVAPVARPGVQALAFHVLRWLGSARALRMRLVPRKPPPQLDALLTCALALLWPAGPPPYGEHTLVDQAVRAAREAGLSGALVNGVLRRFGRERAALVAALQDDPVARWNHPPWWIERLRRDWPQDWPAVLDAANEHPPLTLRVNARRTSAQDYAARLAAAGLAARTVGPSAVALARPVPVAQIPGFAQGDVSVQDAAAQLAAPLLLGDPPRLARGARVLDACAAPGGKTAHLLELADLEVLALDRDAQRLQRVRGTLDRLRLEARLVAADAGDPAAWWDGVPFDAILLDAPCSASGIVRRHPDVRWLRRESDIAALAQMQARLLDGLWPLLAPGGRLLYCTCSVFKAEGEDQIDAFLQRRSAGADVRRLGAPGHLLPLADNREAGAALPDGAAPAHDGFFYALLEKRALR
jgi:16S rRNA (cytosine967-C5)-methyltransferase